MRVYFLDEAQKIFDNEGQEKIICVKGSIEKEVDNYSDAEKFFNDEN